MTYEEVCVKLGFDPMVNPPKYAPETPDIIDDSKISPYAKLTFEENLILCEKIFGN